MGKVVEKVYYKIEFELASSMTIGTGENQFTDKDIARNSKGIPYIPATALAGISRSFFSDENIINDYFGMVSMNQKAIESRLVFYDAQMIPDESKYVVSKRDSVALDVYKTAIDGAKFDMETLEPGVKFITYIEQNYLEEGDKAVADEIVKHWMQNDIYLGAKTMRGYGAIDKVTVWKKVFCLNDKVSLDKWLAFDMYKNSDWESTDLVQKSKSKDKYALKLDLKQVGGISIRKYTTQLPQKEKEIVPDYEQLTVHDKDEILPVIPGTSWAGAFRHRMLELVADLDEKLCFGVANKEEKIKSNIRFSETKISGAKAKIYSRNAIDRFTGGTVDKALFTERTYYDGETTLVISFEKNPEDYVKCALAAAIADLHYGFLAVGGLTSIGRGCFEVKCINGQKVEEPGIYQQALTFMKEWGVIMDAICIFKEKTKDIQGYVVASLTDEYIVDTWPIMTRNTLKGKEHKFLEVRVFDTQQEVKLFRTSIGTENTFYLRHRIDNESNTKDTMDEVQILDIDTKKSEVLFKQTREVYTTGGGRYYLPLKSMENAKIRIRYYLKQDEITGQARICDWRLVNFEEGV